MITGGVSRWTGELGDDGSLRQDIPTGLVRTRVCSLHLYISHSFLLILLSTSRIFEFLIDVALFGLSASLICAQSSAYL
jgi:hypothetical protein